MADYWNKKISIHHLYYALSICTLCAICILVVLCSSRISDEAFQNFSFASTVVSIVAINGGDNANMSDFTNEEKAIFRFVEEIYNGQKRDCS